MKAALYFRHFSIQEASNDISLMSCYSNMFLSRQSSPFRTGRISDVKRICPFCFLFLLFHEPPQPSFQSFEKKTSALMQWFLLCLCIYLSHLYFLFFSSNSTTHCKHFRLKASSTLKGNIKAACVKFYYIVTRSHSDSYWTFVKDTSRCSNSLSSFKLLYSHFKILP